MNKIIKQGEKREHHKYFIKKCKQCNTIFLYDTEEIQHDFDYNEYVICPNCENEMYVWYKRKISNKKYKKYFEE